MIVNAIDVSLGCQALALLEIAQGRLGFRIENVGQWRKTAAFGIVEETALLEQERNRLLPARVIVDQRADLGGASVGNGDNFNEASGIDRLGSGRGEQGVEIDVPLGHQPQQRLRRDDGPRPDEGPFLALDVGIITLRREIEGEEDRPNDQEWPHVRMQLQREGVMQGRILDLGVICEFCPVRG